MNVFQWQFPSGPGDPFGNATLMVLDSLRILIVGCGLTTVLLTIPAVGMAWSITQKYRLTCIALFSIYVSMTEVQRIGDYANWRLLLATICSIWALISLMAFLRFEGDRSKPRWASWMRRGRQGNREDDARQN